MSSAVSQLQASGKNKRGESLTAVDFVFLFFSVLTVCFRLIAAWRDQRRFATHDIIVIGVLILATTESIILQSAVQNGLGRQEVNLSKPNLEAYSKLTYACQILSILALSGAKIVVIQVLEAIRPQSRILLATRFLIGVILLWGISSVFALALQCELPDPYKFRARRCVNQEALYDSVGIINIISDVAIVILPIALLWNIHIPKNQITVIITMFGLRILVPIMATIQLVAQHKFFKSDDRTSSATMPWIWTQVMMNLSIITAVIPSLIKNISDVSRYQERGLALTENLSHKSGNSTDSTNKAAMAGRTNVTEVLNSHSQSDTGSHGYGWGDKSGRGTPIMPTQSTRRNPLTRKSSKYNNASRRASQELLTDPEANITHTIEFSVEEEFSLPIQGTRENPG